MFSSSHRTALALADTTRAGNIKRRLLQSNTKSSTELSALLQTYSELQPRPIPLSTLFSFNNQTSASDPRSSTSYVRSEIPRRLASVIRNFDKLPYICGTNPFIARVHSLYKSSFHQLSTVQEITNQPGNEEHAARLEALVQIHSNEIPTLSKGFSECSRYMSSEDISAFLNQTITSRIGIRLIAEQYVAISHSPSLARAGTPKTGNNLVDHLPAGIIDPDCSPERMVRMCAAFVSSLCDATFGTSPDIKIDGAVDARFAYVPVHLEYVLTEILKNSYRATTERRTHSSPNDPPLPPVLVTISPSSNYLSLRIRDQGGGIPPSSLPHVFSYAFTTARSTSSFDGRDDDDLGGGPYAAQYIGGGAAMAGVNEEDSVNIGMFEEITGAGVQSGIGTIAGFGYGLPLARLYTEYFGGSLELMSLHGHGTDIFVRLPRLDQDTSIQI